MLLFSTLLEIRNGMTRDDFVNLVIKWNRESEYAENRIEGIEWKGETDVRYGTDALSLAIEDLEKPRITAIRYAKTESDGVVWTTDYIMNFDEMKMAVSLERSYREDALMLASPFSTPHFITYLIKGGWLKDDQDLPVARTPVTIDETNMHILSRLTDTGRDYALPAVYVSRTYYDEDPVDVGRMASRLKGIAHVLVQKSFLLDAKLKEACEGRNEYYGAVGIYYPSETAGHRRFLYHAERGADAQLMEKVIRSCMEYANSQLLDPLYTWHGVNNAILNTRLSIRTEEKRKAEEAQAKAENEMDQVYDIFDRDLEKLRSQVEELLDTLQAKEAEIKGLRGRLSEGEASPLLYSGDEKEFFPGEIREIALEALQEACKNTKEGSRRHDVLSDIIEHNEPEEKLQEMREEIKQLFKGYRTMSATMKRQLNALGFTVEEDGRHYRLVYHDDPRYSTVIAKTGSDHREGKNIAAIISRDMM